MPVPGYITASSRHFWSIVVLAICVYLYMSFIYLFVNYSSIYLLQIAMLD